jgi:hypothetical protein
MYLRGTMSEQRLSAIALLHMEADLTKSIHLHELIEIFARIPCLQQATSNELGSKNFR